MSRWLCSQVNGNNAAHEDCLERFGIRSLPSVAQARGTEVIPAVREIMNRVDAVMRNVRATKCSEISVGDLCDAVWPFIRDEYNLCLNLEAFVRRTVTHLYNSTGVNIVPIDVRADDRPITANTPIPDDDSEVYTSSIVSAISFIL